MADRFPLILNTNINQIQEIASGDNLDLTGSGINNAGVITATSFSGPIVAGAGVSNITSGIGTFTDLRVGGDTSFSEDLVVTGNARVTGILTVGTGSLTITDRDINAVGIVTGSNFKTGSTNVHNVGIEAAGINVLGADTPIGAGATIFNSGDIVSKAGAEFQGIVTATTFSGSGASLTGITNANISNSAAIAFSKLATGALPAGITVSGSNITAGAVHDSDVNASANIAGTKISPNFGSQNIVTTGTLGSGNFSLTSTQPRIRLIDSNTNPDLSIINEDGVLNIYDDTNSASRFTIDTGKIVSKLNHDFDAGIDVTGNVIASGNVSGVNGIFSGNVSVGGVLTYEDVTNVDSVGIITARTSIKAINASANAGNYLEIKTNADSSSDIIKAGAGAFFIKGNNIYIGDDDSNKVYMGGEKDGKSFLRFNGSTKLETTNTGVVATGIMTATSFSGGGLRLTDDGADSPILSIMADDGSPWAFQLGNSTYHNSMSTGTMIYNANTGVGYFTHRGNSSYKQFQFTLNDGTSNHRCITLEPSDQSVILYCGNSPRLQTMTDGIKLQATTSRLLWPENGNSNSRSWTWIGEDGAYGIFELKHSDTNDTVTDKKSIRAYATGSVYLYHNDTARLETTSTGVNIPCSSGATIRVGGTSGSIYRAGSPGAGLHFSGDQILPADGAGAVNNNGTDLGASAYRFKNIYTNDLNLSNEGSTNSIDNTWGDFTIQEGESDLFLINNRSGKKYKFNLTEVS